MQVYISHPQKSGQSQKENFEELTPTEFKVTLTHASKIDMEDKAGIQDSLEDLDCLLMRKIKETCFEA
jgi:hypothetical protein